MERPAPQYGHVVRFEYLWRAEEHDGHADGAKFRPCAVVVALEPKGDEPQRVMVCAITHTEPRPPSVGIEIPPEANQVAGLDEDRSWVIVSEVNKVQWSSRRFSRTNYGKWEYGVLPQEVMNAVRRAIADGIRAAQMDVVDRDQIDERVSRQPGA